MLLTHLHLMLNHIPIFGMIVLLFLMTHAVIFKKEKLIKIYLWYFAAATVITLPVFLTGDPSSEYLKTVFPKINTELIETHETFGYVSLIISLVLGISGLVALRYFKDRKILPAWFKYTYLIIALLSVLSISWTGKTGGEIMHSEITVEHTVMK